MYSVTIKNKFKKVLSVFLIVVIFLPSIILYNPQDVRAQLGGGKAVPVVEIGENLEENRKNRITNEKNTIENTIVRGLSTLMKIYNASSANSDNSLVVKEYVLDPIAFSAAKFIAKMLTADIIDWINEGFTNFDGSTSPLYIGDLEGYLADISNEVLGLFLNELGSANLCDPQWKRDIERSLSTPQSFSTRASCTFGGNLDAFYDGSEFSWENWHSATTNRENNPIGVYLLSTEEIAREDAEQRGYAITEAGWGDGTRPAKECIFGGEPGNCSGIDGLLDSFASFTTIPGQLIQNELEEIFGSGIRQLEMADELSEIINILISQLAINIFESIGGLAGFSGDTLRADTSTGFSSEEGFDSIPDDIFGGFGSSNEALPTANCVTDSLGIEFCDEATQVQVSATSTITIIKILINNNGGTATTTDFAFFVDGVEVAEGEKTVFQIGDHVVTESGPSGYDTTFVGDCDSDGLITTVVGEDYDCIVINDDI